MPLYTILIQLSIILHLLCINSILMIQKTLIHHLPLSHTTLARTHSSTASLAAPRVQVEFVSANPTGPLSTGHGRQGILGDCIARLLEATGWDVTREYYFNDGGRQMRVLGDSVKARSSSACATSNLPWHSSVRAPPSQTFQRRLAAQLATERT